MRVGIGYDIHRLVEGRKLILGGVELDHPKGLLGHSDADVLLHAIIDALLGSISAGDIGTHFPDNDENYKDASSMELLENVVGLLKDKGRRVVNVDSVVIAQEPKISGYSFQMRENIARILGITTGDVSVKGTTNEGIDTVGAGKAIAAYAVAMVA